MLRQLLATGAAVAAIAVGSAAAQTSTTPGSSTTPAPGSGAMPPASSLPSTSSISGPASFISRQTLDQVLASNLMDESVYGTDGRSIGKISDLLLDKDGNVVAVVIGVGGFLGIGEKDVAVPFKALQMTRTGTNEERLVLSATKNDLTNAPAFASLKSGPSTTGSGVDRPTSPHSGATGAGPASPTMPGSGPATPAR